MLKTVVWMPGMTLDENKKQVILAALEFARGNKEQAAHALGIHVNTMTNQLAEYEKEDEAKKELDKKNQEEAHRIIAHLRGEFEINKNTGGAEFKPPIPLEPPATVSINSNTPKSNVLTKKK